MIALLAQIVGPSGASGDPIHVVVGGSGSLLTDVLTGGVTAVLGAAVGFGFGRLDRKSQRTQDRRSADLADGTAQLAALVACLAELDQAQRLATHPDPNATIDSKSFSIDAAAGGKDIAWVSAAVTAISAVAVSNQASTIASQVDQAALTRARSDLKTSMGNVRSNLAKLRHES